jgi:hypothetical protein
MICSKEDLLDELIDTRMLDIDEFSLSIYFSLKNKFYQTISKLWKRKMIIIIFLYIN